MNSSILPLKEQYGITDGWLKYRLENVLSQLMKRESIDMWIILAREYNEDPVYLTLIPALREKLRGYPAWYSSLLHTARGDYPLYYNTCYAMELNASLAVPEWSGQEVTIFPEETVCFTEEGVSYLKERQEEFISIAS